MGGLPCPLWCLAFLLVALGRTAQSAVCKLVGRVTSVDAFVRQGTAELLGKALEHRGADI